jgi:hypothetical protein
MTMRAIAVLPESLRTLSAGGEGVARVSGAFAKVWLVAMVLPLAACMSRPVPQLEQETTHLEADYDAARVVKDPTEQIRQVLSVQARARRLRTRLADERVFVPKANAEGSSAQARGRGTFRLERREVDKVRVRVDNLIRRIDGYLTHTAPRVLEGSGYRLYDGRLVEQ